MAKRKAKGSAKRPRRRKKAPQQLTHEELWAAYKETKTIKNLAERKRIAAAIRGEILGRMLSDRSEKDAAMEMWLTGRRSAIEGMINYLNSCLLGTAREINSLRLKMRKETKEKPNNGK